jgi:uncharacterized membrane protein (DUF2068 family)
MRLHWELLVCGMRGHELVGADAAQLRPQDAIFAREDAAGTRWCRCLRCDSWLALPRPEPPAPSGVSERPAPSGAYERSASPVASERPARSAVPERDEIVLPLRGKPLRDKIVLRLIAVDRAFHLVALSALGVLVLLFAADRSTLRATFYKVLADLQGGVASEQSHASSGLVHDLNNAFTTSSSHLHLLGAVLLFYAVVEGIEAVGLWYQQRWAEYLTFLVTASLLPLEVYEIVNHPTPFKVLAFLINIAVVVYLLVGKRLFGLRGGGAADAQERKRDLGWPALERSTPPAAG